MYLKNRWVILFVLIAHNPAIFAQTHVFAELKGAPLNIKGWNLTGIAKVGNILDANNSELILTRVDRFNTSGAAFFNKPLNFEKCNRWIAEFEFRIFDGSNADGLALCFLERAPTSSGGGGGIGIPREKGLKICFDTHRNCLPYPTPVVELRWGVGYSECWSQPTSSTIPALRSSNYNKARVIYDKGNIAVYLNGQLVVSGFQAFNFNGYFGFTSATGEASDNHSIKNVTIYTDMPEPPAAAGSSQTICSGTLLELGTGSNPSYSYSWTPPANLSSDNISNPIFNATNSTNNPNTFKYYVKTTLAAGNSCSSTDSVTITVLPEPSVHISASATTICSGSVVNFKATLNNVSSPLFQWKKNGVDVKGNDSIYMDKTLVNGDIVSCKITSNVSCPGLTGITSNAITVTVIENVEPTISISESADNICDRTTKTFLASATNTGTSPVYQWQKNGQIVGGSTNIYSATSLNDSDIIRCSVTSNAVCLSKPTALSNDFQVVVAPDLTVTLNKDSTMCDNNGRELDAGNFKSYVWNNGSTNKSIIVKELGKYYVTVTDDKGCKASDTTTINKILPSPANFLPADTSICNYGSLVVKPISSFNTYLWNTGDKTSPVSIEKAGTYWLKVIAQNGCVGTDSVIVRAKECMEGIYVPTAFTPNADGKNDILKPLVFANVLTFKFVVYNRFGEKIFETDQVGRGWDGTTKGVRMGSNVFVWACSYQSVDAKPTYLKGTVMLLR